MHWQLKMCLFSYIVLENHIYQYDIKNDENKHNKLDITKDNKYFKTIIGHPGIHSVPGRQYEIKAQLGKYEHQVNK